MAKKIHSSVWLTERATAMIDKLVKILDRRGASTVKAELIEWALEQPYWQKKIKEKEVANEPIA